MKVLFVGEGTVSDAIRCELPAMHLSKLDVDTSLTVIEWRDRPLLPVEGFDVVVFSRPHHDSLMLMYKRLGTKVIVDMDDDFHAIPEEHPGYKDVGNGDPYYLNKLDNCIYIADMVITATSELRTRLLPLNKNIKVIPNGWSADNFAWLVKRSIYKDRLIFGWGGTITHREDFKECLQPLLKTLKEHPEAMVCIVGDQQIYQMLKSVGEKQKLFVPMCPYQLYPAVMSLWDVALVPLLDTEFNRAKSDIKLVDAGARGIPFIASDISIYRNWPGGGYLAATEDDWYKNMNLFLESRELGKMLGKEGKDYTRMREMNNLAKVWKDVIVEVMQ